MGGGSSSHRLAEVRGRVLERKGSIQLSGRYHRLPRTIYDDYLVTNTVLGDGFSGSIYLATGKRASSQETCKFAVKTCKLHGISSEVKAALIREVEIFLSLDHPHVCRLFDVYETSDRIQMVMECLEGGELHERINNTCRFTEHDAADATYQMLLAINYLHKNGVVHRDIKLENFLYDAVGSNHLKLIDFGFGSIWDPSTSKKMKLSCGTLVYTAPEVILKSYTHMCDLWSLGVIVFILLVGYMPFKMKADQADTELDILNGDYSVDQSKWKHVSKAAFDFVCKLLDRDPDKRLTAEQAMMHTWIAGREQLASPSAIDQAIVDSLCQFANASRFRRACMQVMAWSLSNEERAEVRQAFIEMDVTKTGSIKLSAMKQVLEDRFNIEDVQARKVFSALDSNNTEEVRYSEFLAAMMSSRISIHEDLVLAGFKRFDKENTGDITIQNVKQVLGEYVDGSEVEVLLKEANLMPDGKLTLEDFVEYVCGDDIGEALQDAAGLIIEKEMCRPGSMGDNSPISCASGISCHSRMSPKKQRAQTGDSSQTPASAAKSCQMLTFGTLPEEEPPKGPKSRACVLQ